MKKYLLFGLLFLMILVPVNINAKEAVEITSISIEEKTDGVTINNEASYEGLKVNFDVAFSNVDDFIRYKVIVNNSTDKDYQITSNTDNLNKSEFIKYFIHFDSNDSIIKAGSEKSFFITIMYIKEVDSNNFFNGLFREDNTISLDVSTNEELVNPQTGQSMVLLLLIILFVIIIAFSIITGKHKENLVLVFVFLIAPLSVWAIEKITIEVDSHVEVLDTVNLKQFCLEVDGVTTDYYYQDTMTWKQYLSSNLNHTFDSLKAQSNNIVPKEYNDALFCNNLAHSNAITNIEALIVSKDEGCYKFEYMSFCK